MIAVALSPKARALIQVHREAGRPTAADRQRVTAALRAQLGSAVLPLESSALLPLDRPIRNGFLSSVAQRRSATALGVCVVGSALLLARRPNTSEGPTTQGRYMSAGAMLASTNTALAKIAAPVSHEPALPSEAPILPPSQMAPATPRHPKAKIPGATQDTLAQEVLLLSNATTQLSSGQAAVALLTLDEHQRRFSSGVLSEERNAAKARALCMLHRSNEGRAAVALLTVGSPIAARAKEDCTSALARAEAPARSRNTENDKRCQSFGGGFDALFLLARARRRRITKLFGTARGG